MTAHSRSPACVADMSSAVNGPMAGTNSSTPAAIPMDGAAGTPIRVKPVTHTTPTMTPAADCART